MHRIRQWMSSVALVATAGLVLVAARQHFSLDESSNQPSTTAVTEPPRLDILPLAGARQVLPPTNDRGPAPLIASARATQHTYPIREPSAELRQPWRGELPLDDVLPDRPPEGETLRPRRAPEPVARPKRTTRPKPAPQPVVQEEEAVDEQPIAEPEMEETRPLPLKKRRPVRPPSPPARQAEREEIPEETIPSQPVRKQPLTSQNDLPSSPPPASPPLQARHANATHPMPRMARGQIDINSPAMRAVLGKAREHTAHGFSLGQRGATFSARAEFIQALRLVAQALDNQTGSDSYGRALAAGLQAIEEADDFAPKGSKLEAHLNLAATVSAHATPVLKQAPADDLNPLHALQAYYAYAREQLAYSTGQTAVGSEALYALGKLQTEAARLEPSAERMHQAKGMAFHQAALDADSRNFQAANELGVLLARHGQWETAKRLLIHSVQLRPHPEVWQNLSTVHTSLGETELARLADNERRLMQPEASDHPLAGQVQWVDPNAFAASGPQGPAVPRVATQPAPPAAKPATTAGNWFAPWMSFLR